MIVVEGYPSEIASAIHEMMSDAHEAGVVSRATLRSFDEACLAPAPAPAGDEIRAIREREHVSQPMFAAYLNVSRNLVDAVEVYTEFGAIAWPARRRSDQGKLLGCVMISHVIKSPLLLRGSQLFDRLINRDSVTVAITLAGASLYQPALAQTMGVQPVVPQEGDNREDARDIVVTGTRFTGRTVEDSPTPIDSLPVDQVVQGGRSDLTSGLKAAVPGFNTPRPTGSSFADFATPISLRGLSAGQTLILVNGKRRHTVGELNQANSLGRGDITYDLNPIPAGAVGRIEVLRDGAAAQYGSDAIAGVINVVLDDSIGGAAKAVVGTNTAGDGELVDISASYGVPVGDGGVIRATVHYLDQNASNRARPDTRQQYFGAGGTRAPSANYGSGTGLTPANGTFDPREATIDRDVFALGQSAYTIKSGLVNVRLPLADTIEFYGLGGYSRLDGVSEGFFRRAGQDETVRSIFPDGYRPATRVRFDDFTVSAGMRGGDPAMLGWDLSTTYGGVKIGATHSHSVNPSLGASSPTEFYRGGTDNRQWTTNLDLIRTIELGDGAPLKIAAGGEYREDRYHLIAGEPDSYRNGGAIIAGGPNNGRPAPIGAQPTPGTTDADAVRATRHSVAVYAEVEKELFGRLTLVGALRHERYSDFGEATSYKVAGRLAVTPWLAARANYGTGFRAPVLAHSYFNATTSTFINGQQVLLRIFRVDEPAARLVGASDLKPETSKNLSLGGIVTLPGFTASIDYYRIAIEDRIAISSQFQDTRITALLAQNGFPGISAVSYLTNAVDTVTQGIDVTANTHFPFASGRLTASFAANINRTRLKRIAGTPPPLAAIGITTPLFDLTQQVRLTDSQPRDKLLLSLAYRSGAATIRLTNTRYGKVSAVALTGRTPTQVAALTPGYDVRLVPVSSTSPNVDIVQTFGARILTDIEASYQLTNAIMLTAGINNLLNIYPAENLASTPASVAAGTNGSDNAGTLPYNPISPFGFTGRSAFASLSVSF
ncbi:TonB-dependent receptor [Sphingobium sp. BYY-5]|uniref:TonB-dependent receptor domain-containing protein n=1 Tax=Sphingobium sp. BYY-5 TaxID=2926400 RepID=UPI001FA80277|nr:TonB-dependent receptor [Sphingobium sp. BYY-5]MCI4592524.1 TonB-dependent receptor [Sphingobium sp. BYY-5]